MVSADSTGDVRWWPLSEASPSAKRHLTGMASPAGGRIAVSSDGRWIAATDSAGDVRLMREGLDLANSARLPGAFEPVAFLEEDRALLTRSSSNTFEIWDIASGRLLRTLGNVNAADPQVAELAVSADRQWVAAQSYSGALAFRSLAGGRNTLATNVFNTVTLVPLRTGKCFLTGDPKGAIHCWDPESARRIWSRPVTGGVAIHDLVAMNDGRTLVVADAYGKIHVVEVETGRLVERFQPSESSIYTLALSPDGSRLAVGSEAGTVTLVNTENWREEATYRAALGSGQSAGHALNRVLFSGDGRWLVARTTAGELRAWHTGDAER